MTTRRPRKGRHWTEGAILTALIFLGSSGTLAIPALAQDAPAGQRLARLLEKARTYCGKLDRAALDFTCVEKIEERTYRSAEIQPDKIIDDPGSASGRLGYSYPTPRQPYYAHRYVYDYQFVRKGDRKAERRTLIEEDGRKMKSDDAPLTTETIRVENALFGPVGLLSGSSQPQYDYSIAGEETRRGRTIIIIEAAPKPGFESRHCYGRLWLNEDDGSVIKISWDQASIGNFEAIRARARLLGSEPQLISVTEYGREKNGLLFPTEDKTEEAYVKDGQRFVRSTTIILYKEYKFFTVETEVRYEPTACWGVPVAFKAGRPR